MDTVKKWGEGALKVRRRLIRCRRRSRAAAQQLGAQFGARNSRQRAPLTLPPPSLLLLLPHQALGLDEESRLIQKKKDEERKAAEAGAHLRPGRTASDGPTCPRLSAPRS